MNSTVAPSLYLFDGYVSTFSPDYSRHSQKEVGGILFNLGKDLVTSDVINYGFMNKCMQQWIMRNKQLMLHLDYAFNRRLIGSKMGVILSSYQLGVGVQTC